MESGGKAVTKRYRKKITAGLSLVLPVIVLFAILNCFTTYVFYEDYKYKMNLMTEIAAKEKFSGLDAVLENPELNKKEALLSLAFAADKKLL